MTTNRDRSAEFLFNTLDDNEEDDNPCPMAFTHIGGRCYFYGGFKLNWFRAMEFCHSFGRSVSLAAIETRQENEALKGWLVENGRKESKLDSNPIFFWP